MDGKLIRYKIQPYLWFFEKTQSLHENQGTKFWLTKIGFRFSLKPHTQWL